jgi:hypothetical protein
VIKFLLQITSTFDGISLVEPSRPTDASRIRRNQHDTNHAWANSNHFVG